MKYKLSLLENAGDSLREALEKYESALQGDDASYKYVILHFSHFCELIFKYYISKHHPLIIFKDAFSDKFNPRKPNTIGLWETINFIINEENLSGEKLIFEMKEDLKTFRNLRNVIEHFHFEIELSPFRKLFGRLIRMIYKFNDYHEVIDYDQWISSGIISKDQKKILDNLMDEYESNRQEAYLTVQEEENEVYSGIRPKHREGLFSIYKCSECNHDTFIPDLSSSSGYKCTFCNSENSEYQELRCYICDVPWMKIDLEFYEDYSEDVGHVYVCPRCIDPDSY